MGALAVRWDLGLTGWTPQPRVEKHTRKSSSIYKHYNHQHNSEICLDDSLSNFTSSRSVATNLIASSKKCYTFACVNIDPRWFLYGLGCARSVLPRRRANIPQYGPRARLVKKLVTLSADRLGSTSSSLIRWISPQALRKKYIGYLELRLATCNNVKSIVVWNAFFRLAFRSFKNTGPFNSTIVNSRIEEGVLEVTAIRTSLLWR